MTDIDFDSPRRASIRRELQKRNSLDAHASCAQTTRKIFCLSSLILVTVGVALLIIGAVCRTTSGLPEWAGVAPLTAGMVIMIFLAGRTAKATNGRRD